MAFLPGSLLNPKRKGQWLLLVLPGAALGAALADTQHTHPYTIYTITWHIFKHDINDISEYYYCATIFSFNTVFQT